MDPLRIVEAAYTWEASDRAWLGRLIDAASPYAMGGGVIAFTVKCGARLKFEASAAGAGATDAITDEVRRFCDAFPAALSPSLFAPTEFAGNAGWRVERLARRMKSSAGALTNGISLPPMWCVIAGAPRDRAIVLAFPARARTSVKAADPFPGGGSQVLGLVGAHLGAALRLRDIGPAPVDDLANDRANDAVLSPSGDVLHATGDARGARMRESLAEAVLRSERARGRLRRVDSAEATVLWSALVEGRWSVVEVTERDGKRFLLARKNALRSPDILALTKQERDVVWLAAQGHSHKYMAYELGLSLAMVSRRLNSAMRKLRVESRRDLLRKLGVPEP